MKPLNEMSKQQKRLYDVMSDISEECYCAGWMAGNEYAIWDALGRNESLQYGMGEIDRRKLTECASLSLATDSWIIWLDDQDGLNPHDSSEWGAYAISIDEWKKRVADRAVSPAESVQSIDTPDLGDLLGDVFEAGFDADGRHSSTLAGKESCKAVEDYFEAKIAAAHAEGRRSAMEELAKEKERADRAEAAHKFCRDITIPDYRLQLKHKQDHVNRLANELAEAKAATRQTMDLSKLNRFDMCRAFGDTASYLGLCEDGDYVRLADVQALLAQPLQQEGGKEDKRIAWLEFLVKTYGPKSLQYDIEHPTDGLNSIDPAEVERTMRGASNNLQQASTAQAEPATDPKKCWCATCRPVSFLGDPEDNRMVLCPTCGNKRCPHANDHRNACTGSNEPGQPGSAYPADNPLVANLKLHAECSSKFAAEEKGEHWRSHQGASNAYYHAALLAEQASQATPEGAELPPLPSAYAFAPSGHNTGDPYADAEDEQNDMCQEFTSLIAKGIYTADQMRDYARIAIERATFKTRLPGVMEIAATTAAAEPAAWSYECLQPLTSPPIWCEFFSRNKPVNENEPWMRNVVPLYRAAPPQQVTEYDRKDWAWLQCPHCGSGVKTIPKE